MHIQEFYFLSGIISILLILIYFSPLVYLNNKMQLQDYLLRQSYSKTTEYADY